MTSSPEPSLYDGVKKIVIGAGKSIHDSSVFHKLSLVAFFAWVGMGADGLSSSSYGPEAAFDSLGAHSHLGIFVALATAVTVFVISISYSQIIELFPSGGGGYVVASKLLSPKVGMVAGCALLVDYVLTITTSIAAGADAVFSSLPLHWQQYKLYSMVAAIVLLTLMNLRGVKESVAPLVPIFMVFVLSHVVLIVYPLIFRMGEMGAVVAETSSQVQSTYSTLGLGGLLFVIFNAYSLGAGTYTGIEAVSNGMPLLREPKIATGKRTMTYMWVSLVVMVVGLMLGYLLMSVGPEKGKTLNAVLTERVIVGWPAGLGSTFLIITLVSEAAILFIAAQTGFLGGPRVLSVMAQDRWLPAKFSMLSDRLVTQNGVLVMAGAAMAALILTGGSVRYLLVVYAINVFITFLLSQTGMVRHWWTTRKENPLWRKKIFVAGVGAGLTLVILIWQVIVKFAEGGWVTLVVTTGLVVGVIFIRRHYESHRPMAERLDRFAEMVVTTTGSLKAPEGGPPQCDPSAKTAVLLVSGFNGFGMHALLNILRFFSDTFRNYIFLRVGVVDAGNFKGASEVDKLQEHIQKEVDRYAQFVRQNGYYAEGFCSVGTDVADEAEKTALKIVEKFPQAVFFAGQLVFRTDSIFTRWLHNNVAFAVQRRLYRQGIPFVILPIRE